MQVGEIASSSAGDEDFLAGAFGSLEHGNSASPLSRLQRTHQPSSTAAEDQRVKLMGHQIF